MLRALRRTWARQAVVLTGETSRWMSEDATDEERRAPRMVSLTQLGTTLGRARCPQPTQLQRMRHSLSVHGQLTPVIVVEREGKLELVDGFKRRAAATQRSRPACFEW